MSLKKHNNSSDASNIVIQEYFLQRLKLSFEYIQWQNISMHLKCTLFK